MRNVLFLVPIVSPLLPFEASFTSFKPGNFTQFAPISYWFSCVLNHCWRFVPAWVYRWLGPVAGWFGADKNTGVSPSLVQIANKGRVQGSNVQDFLRNGSKIVLDMGCDPSKCVFWRAESNAWVYDTLILWTWHLLKIWLWTCPRPVFLNAEFCF